MITFTALDGSKVTWDENDGIDGPPGLLQAIDEYVESGVPVGCDYWAEIKPNTQTAWEAYLTICGALTYIFDGVEPIVVGVPENPDGYEPEGVYADEAEPVE